MISFCQFAVATIRPDGLLQLTLMGDELASGMAVPCAVQNGNPACAKMERGATEQRATSSQRVGVMASLRVSTVSFARPKSASM